MADNYWLVESEKKTPFEKIYSLKKEIGRRWYQPIGSASFTYHCRDHANVEWVMKSLQKRLKDHIEKAKLKHLLHLEHKNIVRLREVFETDSYIYMVSELVIGLPLFECFAMREDLTEILMASAVRQINDGLQYLHNIEVAHKNLKPSNILSRANDGDLVIRITDSAFSTVLGRDMEVELVNGDITYTAPEIFETHNYGFPADMWALGVIAYIMASGQEPFKRANEKDSFRAILKGDLNVETPELACMSMSFKDMVRRLLAVSTECRLTSVQTAKHAWVTGEEATAHVLLDIPYRLECFNKRCEERAEYWRSVRSLRPEEHLERPLVKASSCIALGGHENDRNKRLNTLLY